MGIYMYIQDIYIPQIWGWWPYFKVDEFIPSVDKLPTYDMTLPCPVFFNPGTMTAKKIGNPNSASPMVSIKIMASRWHVHGWDKNGTSICSHGFFILRDSRKPHLSRWSNDDLYIESSKLIGHGFSFARRDSNRGWMHSLIFYLYIHFYSKVPRSRYRNWDWNPTQRT